MLTKKLTFLQPTATYRELILLEEIGRNPNITQGMLAAKAGVVVAMVNNYIKCFVKEALVVVHGNNKRNMRYELTAEGERKKFDLLLSYVNETVQLYKNVKDGMKERLSEIAKEGVSRIMLYGAADTAELACSAAEELGLQVLGVVDSDAKKQGKELLGRTILHPSEIMRIAPDAVIISSFGYQEQIFNEIKTLESEGIKVRKL